jgi:hypothetical protein
MNTELLKYQINSIVSLSDAEWLHFSSFLELKTLKRNEHLLQEGEICNFISFINSGILIYFKFLENGKLVTTDFAFITDWVMEEVIMPMFRPPEKLMETTNDITPLHQEFLRDITSGRTLKPMVIMKDTHLKSNRY